MLNHFNSTRMKLYSVYNLMSLYFKLECLLFISFYVIMTVHGENTMKEYCHFDVFNPQCPEKEVVLITHAVFGRMRTGHCVKIADNLGCSRDVREYLDSKCSGRQSCSILDHELTLEVQLDCLREMNAYLEASYKCQKVFTPPASHCSSPLYIEATGRSQFLSSLVSKQSSCGLHQTPYILEAKSGQTLDITLHDFKMQSVENKDSCLKYGYLLDTKTDNVVNLCGGRGRVRKVFTTAGKGVQVLLEGAAVRSNFFLIEFKALGCPDIKPPKHSWLDKANGSVTIGCQTSDTKWTMKCVGHIWLGIMKDCPAPKPTAGPTKEVIAIQVDKYNSDIPHVTDNHLFAIGIGCFTVIICVTTIMLGIHCCKRYELSIQKKNTFPMHPFVQSTLYRPVNNDTLLPSFNTGVPMYTLDRDADAPKLPRRTSSMIDHSQQNNSNSPDYFNLVNIDGGNNQEKIYQSIPREGPLLG